MKLDKYDRMFIAFMFVIVTIFNIGTFCFADNEIIDLQVLNKSIINNSVITSVSYNSYIFYADVEKGHTYTITMNFGYGESSPADRILMYGFSDSLDYGSQVSDTNTINASYDDVISITFTATDDYLFLVSPRGSYADRVTVSNFELIEEANLYGVSESLVENVGINQLWEVFENGIDFIGVVVLCAFGFFLVFLLIKKITKGKSDF